MPVCIAGMHRSGTSLITKLLHLCGLYLGEESDLLPPVPDNADGLWECAKFVEINEKLLALLDGDWDSPPSLPNNWKGEQFLPLRAKAESLLTEFAGHEPWGWKDPRNSVTLPFWLDIFPTTTIVVPLRNPLEVASSLRQRDCFSLMKSLDLWKTYHQRLLEYSSPNNRIITHYDAYFYNPHMELPRVLSFLQISAPAETIERSCSATAVNLRHSRFTAKDLASVGASADVLILYRHLCAEADWLDDGVSHYAQTKTFLPSGKARDVQARLKDKKAVRQEVSELRKIIKRQTKQLAALTEMVDDLHTAASWASQRWAPDIGKYIGYRQLVRQIRRVVQSTLPADATVIVISKGDGELLQLCGRTAWHFPQTAEGVYAGSNPACSIAAIAQLEALRARGADFLLIPSTAFWWLDHYSAFRDHLRARYRDRSRQGDICLIFDLREAKLLDKPTGLAALTEIIDQCQQRLGGQPAILDWGTQLGLANVFPQHPVFSPPTSDPVLPYLDHSVDLVVVPADKGLIAEARRVARAAVVVSAAPANGNRTGTPTFSIEWHLDPQTTEVPAVAIILRSSGDQDEKERSLTALRRSLPGHFRGVIVCLREEEPQGHAVALNRAAAEATGDVLVFLNQHVIPLDGWLPALLEIFRSLPQVGAVGGKVIAADGRLEQAGGVVFADGSMARFGSGDYQVDDPLYDYVREVDYSSDFLLATPLSLFRSLGGFNACYQTPAHANADYCFRARELGYGVYYQCESLIVSLLGGFPAGAEATAEPHNGLEDREFFRQRWAQALKDQPVPSYWRDRDTWQALAERGRNQPEGCL